LPIPVLLSEFSPCWGYYRKYSRYKKWQGTSLSQAIAICQN